MAQKGKKKDQENTVRRNEAQEKRERQRKDASGSKGQKTSGHDSKNEVTDKTRRPWVKKEAPENMKQKKG